MSGKHLAFFQTLTLNYFGLYVRNMLENGVQRVKISNQAKNFIFHPDCCYVTV